MGYQQGFYRISTRESRWYPILGYLQKGISLAAVRKMINPELGRPVSYNSYKYFVQHDEELVEAWRAQTQTM